MYKKILIPLDSTPTDEVILKHIRPLARLTQAELILLHVADGYAARLQEQLNLANSQEIKEDNVYLRHKKEEFAKEGFRVKSILLAGDPTEGILKVAQEEKCDLIAMATHGHKLVKDILLGSVANNLRHRTDIPILMVRASS